MAFINNDLFTSENQNQNQNDNDNEKGYVCDVCENWIKLGQKFNSIELKRNTKLNPNPNPNPNSNPNPTLTLTQPET